MAKEAPCSVSELLYRGQRDSRYKLETTLERTGFREITMGKYYEFSYTIKAKVESVTGKEWMIPSRMNYDEWLAGQRPGTYRDFLGYDFLAYLRHHGLPSPFLDWTRSPYVAAHFAMSSPPRKGVKYSAVYVYLESATGIKVGDENASWIYCLFPYVSTHRRHYLQQSQYTVCTVGVGQSSRYASHEEVVARDEKDQDLLWKLRIPVSQRRVFVEHLQRMNINPFSLFETEDALMEDIYLSEMYLRKRL